MDYCVPTSSALIENNVIWSNEGWCITILNSYGATIRNNTCYQNGLRQDGSGELSSVGNNVAIHNNILVPQPGRLALSLRFARSDFTVDTSTVSENYNLLGVTSGATSVQWGTSVGTLAQVPRGQSAGLGGAVDRGRSAVCQRRGSRFPPDRRLARTRQRRRRACSCSRSRRTRATDWCRCGQRSVRIRCARPLKSDEPANPPLRIEHNPRRCSPTRFWCGRKDSNLHGIATASPSSWCVCQFRHFRDKTWAALKGCATSVAVPAAAAAPAESWPAASAGSASPPAQVLPRPEASPTEPEPERPRR